VVVPLQFQLRLDYEVGEGTLRENLAPDAEISRITQRALRRIPNGPITGISREAFARHNPPRFRERIAYGPRLSLRSARSEGVEIPLREYDPDPAKVFMLAGFEGGSCPVLYATFADDPSTLVKIARVLTAADGSSNTQSETITIEGNVTSFFLIEDEPETTFIHSISVNSILSDGSHREEDTPHAPTLSYGDVYRVVLPHDERRVAVQIQLRGYYDRWLQGRVRNTHVVQPIPVNSEGPLLQR
jgi:hypothetical protein